VTFDAYVAGQIIAVAVATAAAVVDHRRGTIPNSLTLPAIAFAVLGYGAVGGFQAAGLSLGGAAVTALLPWLLHRAGAVGGGDVKVLAAIGALLGLGPGLEAEIVSFLFVIAYAAVSRARRGDLWVTLRRAGRLLLRRPSTGDDATFTEVRLGISILVGTIVAVASIQIGSQ
jgi:prepilin peptidase CpaA